MVIATNRVEEAALKSITEDTCEETMLLCDS